MGAMSAAATPVPTGITWEEFLELPDDDVYRHAELIDGEVVLNPPVPLHQQVIMRLLGAIDAWTQAGEGRGEVTFDPAVQITANRGYLPDAAWYPPERCAPPGQPPAWSGPPALAVEVLSPSTRTLDLFRKQTDYARVGVTEFWLIDPREPAAMIHRKPADGSTTFAPPVDVGPGGVLSSPLLPGLEVALERLVHR